MVKNTTTFLKCHHIVILQIEGLFHLNRGILL